jgi:hypothetical protein
MRILCCARCFVPRPDRCMGDALRRIGASALEAQDADETGEM